MVVVALLAVLLALFSLGIYLLYKLAGHWRHRVLLQTWLRVFYGEICLLLLVSG